MLQLSVMHAAVRTLLDSLSNGTVELGEAKEESWNPVGRLARVYEVARNALEYRAQHLVRRAAIERILKRELVFGGSAARIAQILYQELEWAKYVSEAELKAVPRADVQQILAKYSDLWRATDISLEWLVGMVSAEIEEKLNPNTDYQRFTAFAFAYCRKVIQSPEALDAVLFVAVDKVLSQSDNQQVAYHLYKLVKKQSDETNATEIKLVTAAYNVYSQALKDRNLGKISRLVRSQMGPLVLIRDLYFSDPPAFAKTLESQELFYDRAAKVLSAQMALLRSRIKTATVRSLIYVFLTKMVFGLLIEVPVEILFRGGVVYWSLAVNSLFPVVVMWAFTSRIKLPGAQARERVLRKAYEIVSSFEPKEEEVEHMVSVEREADSFKVKVFYAVYGVFFLVVFALILGTLQKLHFTLISSLIFVFFLSVVSFFAYRIAQTAQIYAYKPNREAGSALEDMVMLPIVSLGSALSQGISRLNFLVFVFDFILEAPFKIILRFLDGWFAFISRRKEEVVGT